MMWELAVRYCCMAGIPIPDYHRAHLLIRIVRRGEYVTANTPRCSRRARTFTRIARRSGPMVGPRGAVWPPCSATRRRDSATQRPLRVGANWLWKRVEPSAPRTVACLGFLDADYESEGRYSTTEYLFTWNAFGGLEVEIGSLAIGAEYKYVAAEESDETVELFRIEGQSLTAFLSPRF